MNKYDEFVVYAMEQGWIEPVFHDEEVTMKVIPSPDNPVWQEHLKTVEEDVQEMLELGIVEEAGVNEKGDTVYQLTEYGKQWVQ